MKARALQIWFGLGLVAASLAFAGAVRAGDPASAAKPAIYDESADGSKQIAEALALAGKDGKRVLLQFGANWCPWCHKLHSLFETDKDIAARLKSDYVVVLIDVNKGHNGQIDAKYGHPTRFGLPVVVILDSDGKQLTTKNTGELEEGNHHSPAKVLAFLDKWSPKAVTMQLDWVARASSLAAFGVSPKVFGNAPHSPKVGLISCSGQSAGRRLEATGTVRYPF